MCTSRSPGVSRSAASRVMPRRCTATRRTRVAPKSSRSVITVNASTPPWKPPSSPPWRSVMLPGFGSRGIDSLTGVATPASASSSASRDACSETITTRAPSRRHPSTASPMARVRPAGTSGSCQEKGSLGVLLVMRPASELQVSSSRATPLDESAEMLSAGGGIGAGHDGGRMRVVRKTSNRSALWRASDSAVVTSSLGSSRIMSASPNASIGRVGAMSGAQISSPSPRSG